MAGAHAVYFRDAGARTVAMLPLAVLLLTCVPGAGCRREAAPAAARVAVAPAWREAWRDAVGAPPAGAAAWLGNGWCAAFRDGQIVVWEADGVRRWSLRLAGASPTAPLALDDRLVVGQEDGTLVALRARDGGIVWTQRCEAVWQHPPVAVKQDGATRIVALSQSDGELFAFAAADGGQLWRSESCGRSDGAPVAADGFVAFGNCDSAVQIFRSADGGRAARVPVGEDAQMAGGLAVADGRLFGGTRDGALVAVDVAAARVAWRVSLGAEELFATPAVAEAEGVVIAATPGGEAAALALADGAIVWRRRLGDAPAGAPLVHGGHVWLACDGALNVLRAADGAPVARFDFGRELTSPAVGGPARSDIMLLTDDGYAVVLRQSR